MIELLDQPPATRSSASGTTERFGDEGLDVAGPGQRFTVQQTVALSGLSEHNLRFYERVGLLSGVARDDASGHRRYTAANIVRARMLVCLRNVGMPLEEMRQYFAQAALGTAAAPLQIALLEAQETTLLDRIHDLERTLAYLRLKTDYWRARDAGDDGRERDVLSRLSEGIDLA